jgi:hypothetical protein
VVLHVPTGRLSCAIDVARSFLVAAGLCLSLPQVLAAQVAPSALAPGDTVRYELVARPSGAPRYVEGSLVVLADSVLLISATAAVSDTVQVSALNSLQVAIGSRNYVFPLWPIGALVGCAAGVVIAGPGTDEADPTNHRIGGCLIGLGVGVAAGIFVGNKIKSPNWVDVALDPSGQLSLVVPVGP